MKKARFRIFALSIGILFSSTCFFGIASANQPAKGQKVTQVANASKEAKGAQGAQSSQLAKSDIMNITLASGESRVIPIRGLIRVAINDPEVAEVTVFGSDELYILAKNPGKTDIFAWTRDKKRNIKILVKSSGDLEAMIKKAYPGANVTITMAKGILLLAGTVKDEAEKFGVERLALSFSQKVENALRVSWETGSGNIPKSQSEEVENLIAIPGVKVIIKGESLVLDGEVPDQNKADRARKIASLYSTDIIDLLSIKNPLQVQIEAQILDMDRTEMERIGVNWRTSDTDLEGAINFQEMVGKTNVDKIDPEKLNPYFDTVKVGTMSRSESFSATLHSLINHGKGKIVASPKLTTLSGERATLNVGGQIPVPQTTYIDNRTEVSILWERWGIIVEIEPLVTDDDNISTRIRTEISTLDRANGIVVGQSLVPAKKSRVAETSVSSKCGETIVISGLIQKEQSEVVKKIPLLGDIPALGKLFQHREKTDENRELLIFLTPRVVKAGEDGRILEEAKKEYSLF